MVSIIVCKFVWFCRIVFMFEMVLNLTMLLPADDIRRYFAKHRIIAYTVAVISLIGFASFITHIIIAY